MFDNKVELKRPSSTAPVLASCHFVVQLLTVELRDRETFCLLYPGMDPTSLASLPVHCRATQTDRQLTATPTDNIKFPICLMFGLYEEVRVATETPHRLRENRKAPWLGTAVQTTASLHCNFWQNTPKNTSSLYFTAMVITVNTHTLLVLCFEHNTCLFCVNWINSKPWSF